MSASAEDNNNQNGIQGFDFVGALLFHSSSSFFFFPTNQKASCTPPISPPDAVPTLLSSMA